MNKALNIKSYVADGFSKVCDVEQDINGNWFYSDINESMMYAQHKSWIYFIVSKNEIVKIGETGNPLGIRQKTANQPKTGTEGRIGRYRSGDNTDAFIREELSSEVRAGQVSIWARRCEMISVTVSIGGEQDETVTSFHKDLEMRYLDLVYTKTGQLPRLNKARK